jgi:hypothetical protein
MLGPRTPEEDALLGSLPARQGSPAHGAKRECGSDAGPSNEAVGRVERQLTVVGFRPEHGDFLARGRFVNDDIGGGVPGSPGRVPTAGDQRTSAEIAEGVNDMLAPSRWILSLPLANQLRWCPYPCHLLQKKKNLVIHASYPGTEGPAILTGV